MILPMPLLAALISLVENLQREDMNFIEEAKAYGTAFGTGFGAELLAESQHAVLDLKQGPYDAAYGKGEERDKRIRDLQRHLYSQYEDDRSGRIHDDRLERCVDPLAEEEAYDRAEDYRESIDEYCTHTVNHR